MILIKFCESSRLNSEPWVEGRAYCSNEMVDIPCTIGATACTIGATVKLLTWFARYSSIGLLVSVSLSSLLAWGGYNHPYRPYFCLYNYGQGLLDLRNIVIGGNHGG